MGGSCDSNVRRFLDGCIVCMYRFQNCDDIPCDENAGLMVCVCVCVRFGRPASIMRMDSFGILLVHRIGFLRNYLFSAENIPFKSG